jgi:hypothetical protein
MQAKSGIWFALSKRIKRVANAISHRLARRAALKNIKYIEQLRTP